MIKGTILAFIAVALFSLYVIFGKILLSNVSPLIILVLNQVLAGIIMILIIALFKRIKKIKKTSKRDLKFMYLISIFSAVGGPLLFLLGLKLTSATNTILIGKSEAVLTTLFAICFLKDKITKHQIIGGLIMFFGITIIATNSFSLGLSLNLGDIFIFISALSYALGTLLFKKYMRHIPPELIVGLRNLFGASMLFIISLFLVDFSTIMNILSMKFVLALLGLVVLTTVCGQYLWYKSLTMTSITNVSIAGLSSPLIAIIYALVLLKESINSSQIIGGICIIIGLIVIEFHFKNIYTPKKHKRYLKLKHWSHI